jgi:hydrogenase maturation protease
VLLLGFGNPARGDDGLGPALCREAASWRLPGLTVECDYQLGIEDAVDLSQHRAVIFADAAASGPEPFGFRPLRPARSLSFSSHAASPGEVLLLCRRLFRAAPKATLLSIRGYDFGHFCERLSPRAGRNLEQALRFLRQHLQSVLASETTTDRTGRLRGKTHG